MKLTIKQKLFLIVLLVISGLVGVYLKNSYSQSKVSNLVELKSELQALQISMLQLRRSEKDFLLRKDTKYRDKSEKIFSATHPLIESMEQRLTD